ncbi:MAG: TIR domain-containing protein [Saprospiraceae bacterium]
MTKQDIISLIMQDEIDTAIKAIQIATNTGNDIILQSARWNSLKKEMDNGTISDENAKLTKNRIVNGLLSIAQKLPDNVVVEGVEMPVGGGGTGSQANNKQPKVFISYNHKDKLQADRIAAFFKANNIPVTIDSEAMQAGENIQSFINKCIRETDITISLVSTNSLMSAWVGMESINTLVGEQIANKKFIPVAIETSFFNRSFVDDSLDKIDESLNEINGLIQRRMQKNRGIEDLQDELSRYKDLSSKLPAIVANLKGRLTIDISGDNFDGGMQRVLETITS